MGAPLSSAIPGPRQPCIRMVPCVSQGHRPSHPCTGWQPSLRTARFPVGGQTGQVRTHPRPHCKADQHLTVGLGKQKASRSSCHRGQQEDPGRTVKGLGLQDQAQHSRREETTEIKGRAPLCMSSHTVSGCTSQIQTESCGDPDSLLLFPP
jgi:hypothetical protein